MKALTMTSRDSTPAVVEVPTPTPAAGEVRVRVAAASVNGFDVAVAAGYVWDMMPHTFPVVLGRDFVGTVDALGDGVEEPAIDTRVAGVIGTPELGAGAIGEYVVAPATSLVPIPEGVDDVTAAGVGLAAVAAYDAVDALDVVQGDMVLVSGATGGVGHLAVQLAAARGATVIATARSVAEEQFVRSLGASDTVDPTDDLGVAIAKLAPLGSDSVDKVLHAAGDPAALAATLRPGGTLASLLGASLDQVGRDDIDVVGVAASATPDKLATLLQQVASGRLRVVVSNAVPLDVGTDALRAFGQGSLGKVVVTSRPA
jgi:NADPH:quinone reductase-like Zn-dependent oxidoreductase